MFETTPMVQNDIVDAVVGDNALQAITTPTRFRNPEEVKWAPVKVKLTKGIQRFPFVLTLSSEDLVPSAFKTQWGSVHYSLGVYLRKKAKSKMRRILQVPVNLCCQISLLESLLVRKPVNVVQDAKGTGGKFISGTLTLPESAYLVNQSIDFTLVIKNGGQTKLHEISVSLVQKIAYYAGGFVKSEFAVMDNIVDRHDLCEQSMRSPSVKWESQLKIPASAMPSFETKEKCLVVLYFVQFQIVALGNIRVRGEVGVNVGTHILPDLEDETSVNTRRSRFESFPNSLLHEETSSLRDASSLLPYELLSRHNSLESLPPHYDDVVRATLGTTKESEKA